MLLPRYPKGTQLNRRVHCEVDFSQIPLLCCPRLTWQLLWVDSAAPVGFVHDLRCPLESAESNPVCSDSYFNKDVNLHVSRELGDKGDWAGPELLIIILSCDSPRVQASLRPKSEPSWQPGGPCLQKSSLMAWCPRGGSSDSLLLDSV